MKYRIKQHGKHFVIQEKNWWWWETLQDCGAFWPYLYDMTFPTWDKANERLKEIEELENLPDQWG